MPDICRTNYVRLQNERPRSVRGCPLDKGKPDEWSFFFLSRSISCTGTVFNINLGSTSKIHHVAVNAIGVDWQMHWEPVSLRVSLCTLRDSAVASAAWGGFCAHAQQYIPIPLSYPPFHPSPFSLILLSLQSMIQGACDHEKRQRIGWDIDGTCPVCMRTYILPGTAITSIRKIYEILNVFLFNPSPMWSMPFFLGFHTWLLATLAP